MGKRRKVALWVAGVAAAAVLVALPVVRYFRARRVTTIAGAVLTADADPRKQAPVANVTVTAEDFAGGGSAVSDASGFFRLRLRPGLFRWQPFTLNFRHPDYQPLEITSYARGELVIARLVPRLPNNGTSSEIAEVPVSEVRVRYAMKGTSVVNIGSAVRTFEVPNTGNVACKGHFPCSPDGRWKASLHTETMDAGEGNVFRNVRVSCIAGPCPFTRVESDNAASGGNRVGITVRNWSDTCTFLIEAEVTRTMASDMIRRSYPAIFGRTLSFTLPAPAQGPCIEADMAGDDIVYPLGPELKLSWAVCSAKDSPDGTRLYRCELKPGFRFR